MSATKTTFVLAVSLLMLITVRGTAALGQNGRAAPVLRPGVPASTWMKYLTEARNSTKPSPNRGQGALSSYTEIADNPEQPATANAAALPAGSKPRSIEALPRTIFNTPNFYFDRAYKMPDGTVKDLWMDPRYYHCNTMRQLTDIWTRARIDGATAAEREKLAKWGDCSLGTALQNIQTPYPYTTAHQHYDALMAEAKARGGPTNPSTDWLAYIVSGQYTRGLTSKIGGSGGPSSSLWFFGRALQQSQFLSLLTPKYQTYMLQTNYHEAVSNAAQWSATQYYPEGLGRWWVRDELRVVASAGEVIKTPLAGANQKNQYCAHFRPGDNNAEDPQSVGTHIVFGKFRAIHLGDLTKNKEFELMCPNNRIGTVDVLLGLHHGQPSSNSEVLVHALQPRVAIMNDGTRKGGDPEVMKTVFTSPRLEDLWQIHFSILSGQEYTVPGMFIANLIDDQQETMPIAPVPLPQAGPNTPPAPIHNGKAYWIKVSALQDGSFTVTNTRNGFSKTYR